MNVNTFSKTTAIWLCALCFSQSVLAQTAVHAYKHTDTLLYTVGYAHLDDEWVWDYQTVIDKYLRNTLEDNFKLFDKYPDYIFNFSGANRYRQFKEYYPEDYERMKKYIKTGQWHPCGGSVVENDVLNPSPESLFRQILYGNGYFKKELGVEDHDYLLPDCFGFPYNLPTILAHCGITGFSTQKLTWSSATGIPFNVGTWTGPDGASILAALNPNGYGTQIKNDWSKDSMWLKRLGKDGKRSGVFMDYSYFGTGDVGGAPKEKSVEWLEKSVHSNGPIKVISATSDRMFMDITPEQRAKLPNYKGELLLIYHSDGTVTSQAFMKKANRKNELLAYSAEATSVMANWLGGAAYPTGKLNEAWFLVLSSQFHDLLSGTALPRAYEFTHNDEILAANQFENVLCNATSVVAKAMNTQVQGVPLVVYNPLSKDRDGLVEATVSFKTAPKNIRVYDKDNNEVPSQILSRQGANVNIVFKAKVPSVGYATYDVRPSDAPCGITSGLKITANTLENDRFIVKIDAHGDIAGIYDKTANREVLKEPVRLAFQYERPEDYPSWNMDWEDQKKPPMGYVDGTPTMRIVENGPARVGIEIVREARGSKFIQEVRLSEGSGVEVKNNVDWYTKECALKATFPLTVSNPDATYDMGLGTIMRNNNDSLKYEVPLKQWMDLSDKNNTYGVSILSESKNGSDKPNDNTLRLTLLYTPGVHSQYLYQATQDFGKHEFMYSINPHPGSWQSANTIWYAAEINQPMLAFQTTAHDGNLNKSFSFLQLSNPDLMVKAIKKAENSDEIIVRVYESAGKASTNNVLSFNAPIVSAREVNGQEEPIGDIAITNGTVHFNSTPYQPKTFAFRLKIPDIKASMPVCAMLALPYNADVMSYDKNRKDGSMDNAGNTYPADMVPDTIISEDIRFKTGSKQDQNKNAIACAGQKIALPAGKYNSVYILAASSDGDVYGDFKIDNTATHLKIQEWSGFIGQWDSRIWENYIHKEADYSWKGIYYVGVTPGYIKKDNVAFFTTHRHLSNGNNDPYIYCYMYKYKISIPAGAKELTLPNNDKIKVLAITAAYNSNDVVTPATMLFDTLNVHKSEYKRFQVVAKPVINPTGGILEKGKQVNVTMTAKEGEIHYTTDGTEPDAHSAIYTKSLSIDKPLTLKAAVFSKGVKLSYTTIAEFGGKIDALKNVTSVSNGVQYAWYKGHWDKLPDFSKLTAEGSGTLSNFDISSKADLNNIGFSYSGYIKIPKDGAYTFYIDSDDGSQLIIDDKYVLDNDYAHSAQEVSKTFTLEAGYHSIKVVYFDSGGDKALNVSWETAGGAKTPIPDSILFH